MANEYIRRNRASWNARSRTCLLQAPYFHVHDLQRPEEVSFQLPYGVLEARARAGVLAS